MSERMRSERRVEEVTHGAGNCGTNGSQAGEAVALAPNAAPKMNDQSGRTDLPQRPDTVARATAIYPQATVTALAALQAWSCCRYVICRAGKKHGFGYCRAECRQPACASTGRDR